MAQSGIRFDRFYSGAPVCSPTRGSCLTGRHPFRYGIFSANKGHMLEQEVTLAEALKTLGYTTGHFGKWHLGTLTKIEKESNRGGPQNSECSARPKVPGAVPVSSLCRLAMTPSTKSPGLSSHNPRESVTSTCL